MIHAEPTIERKQNFQKLAAACRAQRDTLLSSIRSVGANPIAIADKKANHWIVKVPVHASQHAHCKRRARFYNRCRSTCVIGQAGRNNFDVSIPMPIRIA